MNATERQLLLLVLLGVGVWYVLQKGFGIAQQVAQPVSDAIANAWLAFTLPAPMTVLGNVVFEDGTQIPLSSLAVKANPATGAVGLIYAGHLYTLQPSDVNGNWPAVLVQ